LLCVANIIITYLATTN